MEISLQHFSAAAMGAIIIYYLSRVNILGSFMPHNQIKVAGSDVTNDCISLTETFQKINQLLKNKPLGVQSCFDRDGE